jgi:hypothetical protein
MLNKTDLDLERAQSNLRWAALMLESCQRNFASPNFRRGVEFYLAQVEKYEQELAELVAMRLRANTRD